MNDQQDLVESIMSETSGVACQKSSWFLFVFMMAL